MLSFSDYISLRPFQPPPFTAALLNVRHTHLTISHYQALGPLNMIKTGIHHISHLSASRTPPLPPIATVTMPNVVTQRFHIHGKCQNVHGICTPKCVRHIRQCTSVSGAFVVTLVPALFTLCPMNVTAYAGGSRQSHYEHCKTSYRG